MRDENRLHWSEIDYRSPEVFQLDLADRIDIEAPRNEKGQRCRWPWEPQMLAVAPRDWVICRHCGAQVQEGAEHPDYGENGTSRSHRRRTRNSGGAE